MLDLNLLLCWENIIKKTISQNHQYMRDTSVFWPTLLGAPLESSCFSWVCVRGYVRGINCSLHLCDSGFLCLSSASLSH